MTENIGKRIKELRKGRSLSQEKLGEDFNIDRRAIGRYEKTGDIPIDVVILYAQYFNVSTDYIILGCEKNPEVASQIRSFLEQSIKLTYKL